MQIKNEQMSLFNTYNDVSYSLENNKPKFFALMEKRICWDELIPESFYYAFYKDTGRKRVYKLESFVAALTQPLLAIQLLINMTIIQCC